MDEGDMILKKEIAIDPEDTNITLSEKLASLGADALEETIELIGSGRAKFIKQDGSAATYAPKLKKEDGLINWKEPALSIHNKVRGLLPWPGAYTYWHGQKIEIITAQVVSQAQTQPVGLVVAIDGQPAISSGAGAVVPSLIKPAGKTELLLTDFIRGHADFLGSRLG